MQTLAISIVELQSEIPYLPSQIKTDVQDMTLDEINEEIRPSFL
jgi:hypothetical protein